MTFEDLCEFVNGYCYNEKKDDDSIKSVTFNRSKGVTTVVLKDGRKGIAKLAVGDLYDERVGLALAYCYATFGSKNKFNKSVEQQLKSRKNVK